MFPELLSDPSLPIKLRVSRPSEENDFRALLNEVPMKKGALSITTDLPSPLRASLEADRRGLTLPILFEDSLGAVCGCASLSIWNAEASQRIGLQTANGTSMLGYFADLRLSMNASREVKLLWREVYRSWVERLLCETVPVKLEGIVTSVLDENKTAVRALGRGRGGLHYLPIYSYRSLSVLLNIQTSAPSKNPEAHLRDLGVRYAFHNPNRYWIVDSESQKLSYFSLSRLEGMEGLTVENQKLAWQSLLDLASMWSAQHARPLFQAAAIGARPAYWDTSCSGEAQRWESPATLYQVTLNPTDSTTFMFQDGRYIDPSQL